MDFVHTFVEVNTIVLYLCYAYVCTRSEAVVLFADFIYCCYFAKPQYILILAIKSEFRSQPDGFIDHIFGFEGIGEFCFIGCNDSLQFILILFPFRFFESILLFFDVLFVWCLFRIKNTKSLLESHFTILPCSIIMSFCMFAKSIPILFDKRLILVLFSTIEVNNGL